MERANEPETVVQSCVPGADSDPLADVLEELVAMGVDFETTAVADASPATHPDPGPPIHRRAPSLS